MDNQKEAMSKTVEIFDKYFKWHVCKTLGGGLIEVIEGKQDKKSQEMDMKDGIDWIYIAITGEKMYFGSRLQWDEDYRTFTIRADRESGAKTELEKRMEARAKGKLDGHYTFQGYFDIDRKEVLSYAIAKTNDILSMIENGCSESKITGKKQIGKAEFKVITWNGMISLNFPIEIVDGEQIDQIRDRRLEMLGVL